MAAKPKVLRDDEAAMLRAYEGLNERARRALIATLRELVNGEYESDRGCAGLAGRTFTMHEVFLLNLFRVLEPDNRLVVLRVLTRESSGRIYDE